MPKQFKSTVIPDDPRERLALLAIAAAAVFIFGDDILRWVGRTRENLRTSFREKMPLDAEIERAREMASSLMPDLRRNHELIVREQVETEELRREVDAGRRRHQEQRRSLLDLRAQLQMTTPVRTSAGDESSITVIRESLRRQFESYQAAQAVLDARASLLKYREEALARAEATQNELLQRRQTLESQVADLEARLQLLRRAGVDSQMTTRQDTLEDCEEQLSYLRKRLTVEERISQFPSVQAADATTNDDVTSDESQIETVIDRYFEHHQRD